MTKNNITLKPSEYILNSSRDYSIYVCENRSIPRVTDGLKDGQRKALWLMRNKAEKIKVISLAGLLISENIYLHGDAAAAGAISMLAAPFCNNIPLLEGVGSFGTRVAPVDGIGASRYIYVKRNKAAMDILYNDLDIVPLKDNYDGSTQEPVTFLPIIPTVLLNGISGIAVGWSTDILPRKMNDIIDACNAVLEGKRLKKLPPHYSYLNCRVIPAAKNAWEFEGVFTRENSTTLRVTELPPDMSLDKFITRLNKLEDDDKIRTFVDRSTKKIDVTVKFKLGKLSSLTDEDIIKMLGLRTKKNERCVVIDWNGTSIKQYDDVNEIIKGFVEWRLGWYVKRYEKKRDDDSRELLFWKGMKACFDDNLPERLPKAKDKGVIEADIKKTTKAFSLDDTQIDRIASLPSYRWAKDYYQQVLDKIKQLEDNIKEYKAILSSEQRIKDIYGNELNELKKAKLG